LAIKPANVITTAITIANRARSMNMPENIGFSYSP
jgi:hypothetical protein